MLSLPNTLKRSPVYNILLPIFQILEVKKWQERGMNPPTPQLIKHSVVREYLYKYRIQTLVETGTYLGVMINALKRNCNEIYTIELDKQLYERAKKKFKKYSHIKVLQGDSAKVLPQMLKKINNHTLFWLDAHFSKGITARGEKETPVMEELKAVLNHRIKNHVILIDDADVFNGKNDYPTINTIRRLINAKNTKLKLRVKNNIIRITP